MANLRARIVTSLPVAVVLISNLTFGDEPGRCPLGSHWVKQHHRRAYQRADGKFFSAATVSAHCSQNPAGYDVWKARFRSGRPPSWPLKQEKVSTWTEEERERVLEALSYFPDALQNLAIRGLYRMQKSVYDRNAASGDAAGDIVLYDPAFDLHQNLSQVLAHELAHRAYSELSPNEADDYRAATLWFDKGKNSGQPNWVCLRKSFEAPDGGDSPAEDFSNGVEYYLFNPNRLKAVTPQAYDWIKGHFGANFKLGKGSS